MLPAGPPPRIPYAYGGHTLAVPGRPPRAFPAPLRSVTALMRWGSGWLAAGQTAGGSRAGLAAVTRLDGSLDPEWTHVGAGRFAVGSRGARAYFVTRHGLARPGRLEMVAAGGRLLQSWTIPAGRVALPVGITSHRSVVYNLGTATGGSRGSWITAPAGRRAAPRRLPVLLAQAAHGDLVAARSRDGCQVVLVAQAELWRRCDGFTAAAFSPDGRHLAAWHSATGGEHESAYVLDARTGHRVTDTAAGSPDSFQALPSGALAWEDSRHLLIAFHDGRSGDSAAVRLRLDGRLARATKALRADRSGLGFVFASHRG